MEDEHTIIDGDILEDTFEDKSGTFDRFAYVIVSDPSGHGTHVVPYIYARNISRVRESLTIIPMDVHPDFENYSVRGNLLQVITQNPTLLCSLVEKQDAIIPALHQELQELEQLEMLDRESARSLSQRLTAFMKTMKIGDYSGDGIFWLPENYHGDSDTLYQEPDEEYEDYMRRIICTHIKSRPLPMAHIIPVSEEKLNMVNDLISSLSNYEEDINDIIQYTHFVVLFCNRTPLNYSGLKTLMTEEFRCVKNEENVDGSAIFVFNQTQLDIHEKTIRSDRAHDNLRYYVGDYLDEMDLSHSFITGSAITASLIKTSRDYDIQSREVLIDILYPKVLTHLDPENKALLQIENINLWNIRATSDTEGIMTKGSETVSFTIQPGSDVDIAVDNTIPDEEYRAIAI